MSLSIIASLSLKENLMSGKSLVNLDSVKNIEKCWLDRKLWYTSKH